MTAPRPNAIGKSEGGGADRAARAAVTALRLTGIKKAFGATEVLKGIDLTVEPGKFVVFVGPSGCGKSTLLRIIAGLETQTAGAVEIAGRRVDGVPPAKRGIAMVFQTYALYPHLTAAGNMALALKEEGVAKAERDARVAKAAAMLRLDELLARRPAELSGGQRQRVAIGRAIVRDPKLFLFDEPLSNLDAALRVNTRLEIARLHKALAAAMIYVTHDQTEAMTLADTIVVLNGGRVEQAGRPIDLYNRPDNLFVAGFIGSPRMNFLPDGHGGTLGVRPEHLVVGEGGRWAGTIRHAEHLGSDTFLYVSLDAGELTVRLPGQSDLPVGASIGLEPMPGALHRFDRDGRAVR